MDYCLCLQYYILLIIINGIFNIASFCRYGNMLSSAGADKDLGTAMDMAA